MGGFHNSWSAFLGGSQEKAYSILGSIVGSPNFVKLPYNVHGIPLKEGSFFFKGTKELTQVEDQMDRVSLQPLAQGPLRPAFPRKLLGGPLYL